MTDNSISRIRETLRQAKTQLASASAGDESTLAEALDGLASALDRLAGMEARLAAQQALLDERLLRVERNRLFTRWNSAMTSVAEWRRRIRTFLTRSHLLAGPEEQERQKLASDYDVWVAHEQAELPSMEQAHAEARAWSRQPSFSMVLIASDREWLVEVIRALHRQVYQNYEVCIAIEERCAAWAIPLIREDPAFAAVRQVTVGPGTDAAGVWNAAAALATGEFLLFLAEGDALSPWALHFMAESLQTGPWDLLYSDEDCVSSTGRRSDPIFKPDWSPHLMAACMYIGRSLTVKRESFTHLGGFRSTAGIAPFHDLALTMGAAPSAVCHLPRVLFHSCGTPLMPTVPTQSKAIASRCLTVIVCSRSAGLLANCLESVRATAGEALGRFIVVGHEETGPNEALRAVVRRNGGVVAPFTGRFNFAAMNNLGAALADTPYLLFLNDDVTAACAGWAERLVEPLESEAVGITGSVLWYPTGVLQHAGIAAGIADGVGHIGRFMRSSALWPWLSMTRDVSAVTGACLAIGSELFRSLGGFDPAFPNNYNDVDLCFRARARGHAVVCVAAPGLVHAECRTRQGIVRFDERYRFYTRWQRVLSQPDPYYSPSLAPTETIALNLSGDTGYRSAYAS